jgi:hypothetical protein
LANFGFYFLAFLTLKSGNFDRTFCYQNGEKIPPKKSLIGLCLNARPPLTWVRTVYAKQASTKIGDLP